MGIRLGNLSLEEMEKIAGVKFPDEFIEFMEDKRQEDVSIPLKKNTWHCFHLPFELVLCGDDMVEVVKEHLVPLGGQFEKSLQVSISNVKE